jgi:microcystin-dependent protein
MDSLLGEIMLFAGKTAPARWMDCDGELLQISQFQGLFSLLGTTYGGDGKTTFALPDMRGRIPVSAGQRPGGYMWNMGDARGQREVVLFAANLGAHSHAMYLSAQQATSTTIGPNMVPAATTPDLLTYSDSSTELGPRGFLDSRMVLPAGSNEAHPNVMPTAYLRYIICVYGITPSPSSDPLAALAATEA